MNVIISNLGTLLLSGVTAAIVSGIVVAVMQKRNEKESRLFNAKFEAYKKFSAHLMSRFTTLIKNGDNLNIATLSEISAECLLVSNSDLNKELKKFIAYSIELYEKCSNRTDKEEDFDSLSKDAERIEELMRKDLGFK